MSDSGANFDVDPDISNFDPASIANVSIKVRQLKDNCVCSKMGRFTGGVGPRERL